MAKKVLITGTNGYIGNQLAAWLQKSSWEFQVTKHSVRNDDWKKLDLSVFDVVVHTAGIAHIKETKENQPLYYKINRDLAYHIAKKAKSDNVPQFIFLSTMSVYGLEEGVISKETPLNPQNAYGKSKMEAEKLITDLNDVSFKVAILRPPMVYGKGCRGNYPKLSTLAKKARLFPNVENSRSMIYIDNLSEFIRQLIENKDSGVFHPQNREYSSTSEIVKVIADVHGRKMFLTKLFNPIIGSLNLKVVKKVFGNLVYEKNLSNYKNEYRLFNLKDSIIETESNNED